MLKSEVLIAAAENLFAAEADQKASEAESLSAELCQAMQDAIEAWTAGTVPAYLRPVALRMRDVQGDWQALPRGPKGTPAPAFGTQFWKSLTKLQQEFKTAQTSDQRPAHIDEPEEQADVRYTEPISVLIAQHVPPPQICKMYRAPWPAGATDGPGLWDNARNTPMLAKYHKEVREPGSVLGESADEFPAYECHEQAQRQQRERELADRILAAQQARRQRQIAELASQKQAGPDSGDLAELVSQGVGGIQIARMRQTTVEEIEKQCREQGIPVPPRRYSPAVEIDPNLPDDVREARQRIGGSQFDAYQGRPREDQPLTPPPATTATDDGDGQDFGGDPSGMDT